MSELNAGVTSNQGLFESLKHRRFFPFLFSYIIGAFTVIQLTEWITNRYGYSPFWTDAIFLLLLLVLPGVILFIYNHGAPGPDAWSRLEKIFYPANAILAVGLTVFAMQGKYMGKTTQEVVVVDEEGEETTREVPVALYSKSITMLPTEIEGEVEDWLRTGVGVLLEADLEQNQSLYVTKPSSLGEDLIEKGLSYSDEISTKVGLDIAKDKYSDYLMRSRVTRDGDDYVLYTAIYQTNSGKLFRENEYRGESMFDLVDQLSNDISAALVSDNEIMTTDQKTDLNVADVITESEEAFKKYVQSIEAAAINRDYATSLQLSKEAVELDPQSAIFHHTVALNYMSINDGENKAKHSAQALELSEGLPERLQLEIKKGYYLPQDFSKLKDLLAYYIQLYPNDYSAYSELIGYHELFGAKKKALEVAELARVNGHTGSNLLKLSSLYRSDGQTDKALKTFEEYEKEYPEKAKKMNEKGAILIEEGRLEEAKKYFDEKALFLVGDKDVMGYQAQVAGKMRDFGQQESVLLDIQKRAKSVGDTLSSGQKLAEFYVMQGRYNDAIRVSEATRNIQRKYYPPIAADFSQIYHGNLMLYVETGRKDEIEAELQRVKDLYSTNGAIMNIGCMIDANRNIAYEEYDELASTYEGCKEVLMASDGERITSLIEGFVFLGEESYDEAVASFEKFAEISGMIDSQRKYFKLFVYDQAGQSDNVLEMIEQTDEHQYSDNAIYYRAKATALAKEGKKQESKEALDIFFQIYANADTMISEYQKGLALREELGE